MSSFHLGLTSSRSDDLVAWAADSATDGDGQNSQQDDRVATERMLMTTLPYLYGYSN